MQVESSSQQPLTNQKTHSNIHYFNPVCIHLSRIQTLKGLNRIVFVSLNKGEDLIVILSLFRFLFWQLRHIFELLWIFENSIKLAQMSGMSKNENILWVLGMALQKFDGAPLQFSKQKLPPFCFMYYKCVNLVGTCIKLSFLKSLLEHYSTTHRMSAILSLM